jgi:hypothetical protein
MRTLKDMGAMPLPHNRPINRYADLVGDGDECRRDPGRIPPALSHVTYATKNMNEINAPENVRNS